MQRVKARPLGDIIREFLREEGLETPLNEYKAVACWNDVMGDVVARYTSNVSLRGGILYVSITSPALRQNMLMNRTAIAHKINAHIGAQVVQNVVVR